MSFDLQKSQCHIQPVCLHRQYCLYATTIAAVHVVCIEYWGTLCLRNGSVL
jgi:hypothetical protein